MKRVDISKICADFFRGAESGLKASHARELVAAFWGYRSHAALLSEDEYPLVQVQAAQLLVPNLQLMELRRARLSGIPESLSASLVLADKMVRFLRENELFSATCWLAPDLPHFLLQSTLRNLTIPDEAGSAKRIPLTVHEGYCFEARKLRDAHTYILRGEFASAMRSSEVSMGKFEIAVRLARVAGESAFAAPVFLGSATVGATSMPIEFQPDKEVIQMSAARTATPATPVHLGKCPQWLSALMKNDAPAASHSFHDRLDRLQKFFGVALDHWGTTDWNGVRQCFVTEPYHVDQEKVSILREKGRRLGFAVVFDPVAFHNPEGGCQRVLVFPTDLSPLTELSEEVCEALKTAGLQIEHQRIISKFQILRGSQDARQKFETEIRSTGRTSHDFFDRIVSVDETTDGYLFHCLKKNEPRLKRVLAHSERWAKESGMSHPLVQVKAIEQGQLIPSEDGLLAGSDSFYVQSFEHKWIRRTSVDRVRGILLDALGTAVARTAISEVNEFDEQHIFIELTMPIAAKHFQQLYSDLKPLLAATPGSGTPGSQVRKSSAMQSTSKFLEECLSGKQ